MKIKATTMLPYLDQFNYGQYEQETINSFISDLEKVKDIKEKDKYGSCLMGSLNLEILKKVHSLGGDVNEETNTKGMRMTLLSQALYWVKPEIVKYLLENGANPLKTSEYNSCAWDYMMSNISCNKEEKIKCLDILYNYSPINLNTYLDSNGNDLFLSALYSANYDEALWLVNHGFKLTQKHLIEIEKAESFDWEDNSESLTTLKNYKN